MARMPDVDGAGYELWKSATIALTTEKTVSLPTVIDGGALITLTGNLQTRLLVTVPGRGTPLELRNITLDRGYSNNASGGAVRAFGPLTMTNVTVLSSGTAVGWWSGALQRCAVDLQLPNANSHTGAGLDPRLSALTFDSFSATYVRVPQLGSPLIDAGFNCPLRDQRGAERVGVCDIGAVEFGGLLPMAHIPLVMR